MRGILSFAAGYLSQMHVAIYRLLREPGHCSHELRAPGSYLGSQGPRKKKNQRAPRRVQATAIT